MTSILDTNEVLNKLRKATRRKAVIGCGGHMTSIQAMDDSRLIRTYRASRTWYKDVCTRSNEALKLVFDMWKELPRTSDTLSLDEASIPDCCFEKEAEAVVEMMETARAYLLCIRSEVERRKLLPVVKKMDRPFACGLRGFNAHHTPTSA